MATIFRRVRGSYGFASVKPDEMSNLLEAYDRDQTATEALVNGQTDMPMGIVLVGPGKHFGAELVERFVQGGCRVAVVTSSASTVEALKAATPSTGNPVKFWCADVTRVAEFENTLREVAAWLNRVDCVIYNPKCSINANGLSVDLNALQHSLSVNVTGGLATVQALMPNLQDTGGSVILTGGGYKDAPDAEKFALSVGKASLHGLFKAIQHPLKLHGVKVSTVIISGAVRRAQHEASSRNLAELYWTVFQSRSSAVHRFPNCKAIESQLEFQI